jgi:hypothetical protein
MNMPSNQEINNVLTNIVEEGYRHFIAEYNAFHAQAAPDANAISFFLGRIYQYGMLFWGYEYVTTSLGTADANQVSRVAQIRAYVEGQAPQIQDLLNRCLAMQAHNYSHQPPVANQNATQQADTYRQQIMAEVSARQAQSFAYTQRLRELVQGGMPFVQAQVIAKQETGAR